MIARLRASPLSISRLGAGFFGLIGTILVLLILYGWWQIDRAGRMLNEKEILLAKQEAQEATTAMVARMQFIAQSLGRWDETQRRLSSKENNPAWHGHRLQQAGILPETVDGVGLYDRSGRILAPAEGPQAMPDRLPVKPSGILVKYEAGNSHLYYFFPILDEGGGNRLLGYGGLMFDLIDELRADRQFRFLDLHSIHLDLPDETVIDPSQLAQHLDFKRLPNMDFDSMREIYGQTIVQLTALLLLTQLASAWLLYRFFVHPVRRLAGEIGRLSDANNGTPCPMTPLRISELEGLRRAFYDYHQRLSEMNQNLERSSQSFFDQARRDPLTGVFNRRAYDEDWRGLNIDREIGQCALILFDCDHFKAINDTYGHQVGDQVIKAVAAILQNTLRGEDRLYRLGGDEFATVLAESDADNAEIISARCQERMLVHDFRQYGVEEPVTISIGIAHSSSGILLGELQKQADIAMYAAKRPNSRKIEIYGEQLQEASPLLANKSISAIYQTIQDPFLMEMRYQPVVQLDSREPAYVEALSRIKINGEIILPADIFPVVQARRIDAEFDQAVIQAVQRDLEFGRVPMHLGISINVSAVGLLSNKVTDMLVLLKQVYPEYKFVVEITETALIEQIDEATKQIHKLREAGCLIALDDFGSGYSSLRYLASMPVDLVKFDISMMRLLEHGDDRQKQVVREVAHLVRSAGYKMVAEGIESQSMLDQAMSLGFDYAQGFYFASELDKAGRPA
ncbi:MAG: bifunctional diguanylate cyclase/phosphodiesterase [Hydrogenophilaceae bacterium]|nr:bifunctional diguanylate cyclase/phosphodiesterase [Hydrogenophilaceae bacterium]